MSRPGLSQPRYRGIFPVAPTTFAEDGTLDLHSQRRCIDFMIDSGVDGLCILANFSEQFLLADDEREVLTRTVLEHVRGRVPVIVTTTHTSTAVCAARSRRAQDMGAAMVMVMPPYHGATFRVGEAAIYEFYARLSDSIGIPILVQDAPASGTPLPAPLLARMAQQIEQLAYFKIEVPMAAAKLPGTTIDMNASADPGSSFLADSIRFRPCGLGVGTSSTPLEPGQSVTVRGAFAGVPESGVSGFYLIIYGGDGGFYGKALDTVQIESSESGDTPTAAETIRTCTAESDRIEAALKKWSKDKKGEYSGPVTIDELVPEYLPKRPTLYEYAPGGYPSDIGRGVVAYGSLTANPPCTQDRPFIPFVYGG